MHRNSVRKLGAFSLAATVWFSAVSAIPMTASGQASEDSKNDKKAKAAKKEDKGKAQAQTAAPKSLSVKEDPTQIGKRKINSGSDKLFGWLGASHQKEVSHVRQLAIEVEQQ